MVDTDLPAPSIAGRLRVDFYAADGTWYGLGRRRRTTAGDPPPGDIADHAPRLAVGARRERDARLRQLLADDRSAGMDLDPAPAAAPGHCPASPPTRSWSRGPATIAPRRLESRPGPRRRVPAVRGQRQRPVTGSSGAPPVPRLPELAARPGPPAGRGTLARSCCPGSASPRRCRTTAGRGGAHRTESSRTIHAALTDAETARLLDTARHAGLTPSTIVQGAWALRCPGTAASARWCSAPPCPARPTSCPGRGHGRDVHQHHPDPGQYPARPGHPGLAA